MIQNHSLFIDDAEGAEWKGKNNEKILRFLVFEIWSIWYTLKSEKYDYNFFSSDINADGFKNKKIFDEKIIENFSKFFVEISF